MKKIALAILFFLIFFLILEISLRISGRLRTYSEKNFNTYQSGYEDNKEDHLYTWAKNDSIYSVQTEFQYSYLTNEYGLLKIHDYKNSNKDSSIVFIGDSFVFGVGAAQDSSVCSFLEQKLAFNFINAGIPGSDPFYEKKLLDSIFYPLGYKKYIFMVNFSDFYDYIFKGGSERFLPSNKIQYRTAPSIEFFYEKSLIVRAITHLIFQRDFSLQSKKNTTLLKTQAIDHFAELFNTIPKELDFIVILQPYPRQYKKNNKITLEILNYKYLEDLEGKLTAKNIKTINLDSSLKQFINTENYLDYSWKLDGHYNANGYELLSEIIAKELKQKHPSFLEFKNINF